LDQPADRSNQHWVQSANLFSPAGLNVFSTRARNLEGIRVFRKVTLPLGLLFTPYPFFQWSLQSKEILLNLRMECSPFNAQGSRVIIVVVQIGAGKIY